MLVRSHIEEGMIIQRAGKSAVVIRIEVPKINPHKFYEELQDDVYMTQDSAKRLLDWFQLNSSLWASFNSLF